MFDYNHKKTVYEIVRNDALNSYKPIIIAPLFDDNFNHINEIFISYDDFKNNYLNILDDEFIYFIVENNNLYEYDIQEILLP